MIDYVSDGESGVIDEEGFLDFMAGQMKAASDPDEIKKAFKVMVEDKDGSGIVSVSDLRNILTNVGERLTVCLSLSLSVCLLAGT